MQSIAKIHLEEQTMRCGVALMTRNIRGQSASHSQELLGVRRLGSWTSANAVDRKTPRRLMVATDSKNYGESALNVGARCTLTRNCRRRSSGMLWPSVRNSGRESREQCLSLRPVLKPACLVDVAKRSHFHNAASPLARSLAGMLDRAIWIVRARDEE
jgi:hypothetical protein